MESTQLTGSFKERGARNHALSLSYHAKQLGIQVNVTIKGDNANQYRLNAVTEATRNNATYMNGYDHLDILAGAGTIGIEILEEMPDADFISVPIGGRGLIAGISTALKLLRQVLKLLGFNLRIVLDLLIV
uniref:PALP domain-containing protein n=1 Tax=Rhabditophanes sp. KR3021 TaxID=114890 RepID=A0AC35TYN9_9BILA